MVDEHADDTAPVGASKRGKTLPVDRFEFVMALCRESIGWLVMCTRVVTGKSDSQSR